jgi:phosphoglycolate phosphatase
MTVKKFLPEFSFDVVLGVSPAVLKKPDPAAALQIAKNLKIPPSRFLYLGDTNTDMKTALAAGMFPIGALWGFRTAAELLQNGAKALIEHPLQLLDLLDKPK